jgi:hypothetical protein
MEIRSIFRNRLLIVITEGGTQEARCTGCWMSRAKLVGGRDRQIRSFINAEKRRGDRKVANSPMPRCRENPLGRSMGDRTANRHR